MSTESELIQLRTEINNLRQLEHILLSPEFDEAYKSVSPAARELPHHYIKCRDVQALREWIRVQRITDLNEYTVKQLRAMGRDLKIEDYHLLSKLELIREIKTCRMNEQELLKNVLTSIRN